MPFTYHDDPALKEKRVENAKRHRDNDRLVTGAYCDKDMKGCSVGCDAMELGYVRDRSNPHRIVSEYYGTPLWLEHVRDNVFEHLPNPVLRGDWHVDLAEAIPVGVDLTRMYHAMCAWLLGDQSPSASGNRHPDYKDVIASVRSLHERALTADMPYNAEWVAAFNTVRDLAEDMPVCHTCPWTAAAWALTVAKYTADRHETVSRSLASAIGPCIGAATVAPPRGGATTIAASIIMNTQDTYKQAIITISEKLLQLLRDAKTV